MVPRVALHVRTPVTLAAAAGTVLAALLLHGRASCPAPAPDDSGIELAARLTEDELAILVTAPDRARTRPPISLAVAIDASSSMSGEPLANAKAAAVRLLDQLEPGDAFAIVAFSQASVVVSPVAMASDPSKARARAAIGAIVDPAEATGTCLACGLDQGAAELERSPIGGGVRRLVVISDGDPNLGIGASARGTLAPIRDEAQALASDIARRGISVSSVGVGLDYNEALMTALATLGHGNYYFVEDTRDLATMFDREIESVARTVAYDVELVVNDRGGVIVEPSDDYPMTRIATTVKIPIADLQAGETRRVVLPVSTQHRRAAPHVHLDWKWAHGRAHAHTSTLGTALVVPGTAADRAAYDAIEQVRSARTIAWATRVHGEQGPRAAIRILEDHAETVRADRQLGIAAAARIERAQAEAIDTFQHAPPSRARKVGSVHAYELTR